MPKALPPSKINSVVNKLKEGKHCDVIHSETGVSTGMITKIRSLYCPDLPKHCGGHPPKLSAANIQHASHLLTGPKPTTPCLVAQELTAINKVKVSGCTVHSPLCQALKASLDQ
ncbi:hypothetical protein OPQ81_004002 [Rhizoctonia solani]|nr:hypothetical protein OPQ81_004002 [Rhizoctonia solani]